MAVCRQCCVGQRLLKSLDTAFGVVSPFEHCSPISFSYQCDDKLQSALNLCFVEDPTSIGNDHTQEALQPLISKDLGYRLIIRQLLVRGLLLYFFCSHEVREMQLLFLYTEHFPTLVTSSVSGSCYMSLIIYIYREVKQPLLQQVS